MWPYGKDAQLPFDYHWNNLRNYEFPISNTDISVDMLSDLGVIKDTEQLFKKFTAPTQKLPKNIGNMYTASIFSGMISYLLR